MIFADDETHSRSRRVFSHAFSDKALLEQESLIQKYVDQLILQLKDVAAGANPVTNVVNW